ncbi:MAG: hypothetical protein D6753_06680 [Planctomycetota bacterium]|nr:MAG: hypothetical protein D6753_06680 [Planctomycetota bacterium]
MQLVAPAQAGPSGSLWTVQEQDAFGNCTARYQLQDTTSDSGRAEIRREVVAYRASPTDSIPLTYEPSGAMRYEFRPDGFVDRWAGEVNLAIRVGEGVLAETRHRVSMRRVAVHRRSHSQRESLVGQFAHLSARVAPVGLPPHLSALRRRELLSQAALNDATLESLLHDLMQIEQGLDDGSDSELVNRLASFVQIHPESIGALAKSIADQRASLVRIRILGQALAAVGTADCQAALCRAVRQHEGSADATLELILALGSLKVPTVETIQCLQSIANRIQDRDVGWTAELAVGAAGRRLAGTDRWLSARIAQDFVQRLEATDDDDERVQYLLVLGNLGHADALATILTHVRAESVRVRAAAVWALRFLEHSAARDAILSALQGDVSLEVRRQALEALGQRANEDWAVSALETTAGEKGLDASLRSRALQILGHALSPSDPRLVAAARRCIEEGSDGDLQQVAQRTLVNAAARPAR